MFANLLALQPRRSKPFDNGSCSDSDSVEITCFPIEFNTKPVRLYISIHWSQLDC